MTRIFIETPLFQSQWSKLGLGEKELENLQDSLLIEPEIGAMVQGTGGLRKVRVRFPGRGKSGSCRVCYVDFEEYAKTYFLTVYSKKERDNFDEREKQLLKILVKTLREEVRRNHHA